MISLILVILAGFFNSIMDELKFHYIDSVFVKCKGWLFYFSFPGSWTNKWKNGDHGQGEAFLGSSTVFVWLTDLWHFAQMLMKACLIAGIILYQPIFNWWADFIIYSVSFSLTFELFFKFIWKSKT